MLHIEFWPVDCFVRVFYCDNCDKSIPASLSYLLILLEILRQLKSYGNELCRYPTAPLACYIALSLLPGTSGMEWDKSQPITLHYTVYPKKYAHGFCFAVLCCCYTLTDFPIYIRLTSLALWQSNDCPSASKATLMNVDKYFMWIHYERLHNHNKTKHNKTVCIFLGIYCSWRSRT